MFAVWIGLKLTVYGMGLVFVVLAVLAAIIGLLVRFDRPRAADARAADGRTPARAALAPDVLAAVVIACRAHRMFRRKQAAPEMRMHEPGSLPSRWIGSGRTRQNRSWSPGGRYS
jgi:Na+-transporting methylmalonyl-CoA/oxaloacetate decarboxylase gamma subunit